MKAPLENKYDSQRRLVWIEIITSDPEGRLVQRTPSSQSATEAFPVGVATAELQTGRGEGVGCGLGLKCALIAAAVVNEVEIIQKQSRTIVA